MFHFLSASLIPAQFSQGKEKIATYHAFIFGRNQTAVEWHESAADERLYEVFLRVELWHEHILPVRHAGQGHEQTTRGDAMSVVGQEAVKTLSQALDKVEGRMEGTQCPWPCLTGDLQHVVGRLAYTLSMYGAICCATTANKTQYNTSTPLTVIFMEVRSREYENYNVIVDYFGTYRVCSM